MEGTDQVAYLQCELGTAHFFPQFGFDQDNDKAARCFEKALAMGYSKAGWYLAALYAGKGGPDLRSTTSSLAGWYLADFDFDFDYDREVIALQRALEPCDCWTDGNCVRDLRSPHDYGSHTACNGASDGPAMELARAYEYSDLGRTQDLKLAQQYYTLASKEIHDFESYYDDLDAEEVQQVHAKALSLTTKPGPFIPLRRVSTADTPSRKSLNR